MGEFTCKDINGLDVTQFVFGDDGVVYGIISSGGTVDQNTNPTNTTYTNIDDNNQTLRTGLSTDIKTKGSFNQPPGTELTSISQECCNSLNFIWDSSKNKCYWSETCDSNPDLKIVLGAKGNESAFFQVNDNETCQLEVKFKYLLQFDCNTLNNCIEKLQTESTIIGDISSEANQLSLELAEISANIDILNQQLSDTQNAWDATIRNINQQIVDKEAQKQTYERNIVNLETISRNSSNTNQRSAYETEIQYQQNQLELTINELSQLEQTLQEQTVNKENDINRIQNNITSYTELFAEKETILNEVNVQLASLNSGETINCLSVFKNLNIAVTLDKLIYRDEPENLNGQVSYENIYTLDTIYEEDLLNIENIVDFFDGNCNTGLYLTGETNCVNQFNQCVVNSLGDDCGVFSSCTLNSDWVEHSFKITDVETLSAITNENIKLGFLIKDSICDFNILVDRIEINKICTEVKNEDIYITKCPKFDLERVIDNKKSWVVKDSEDKREYFFDNRTSNYLINHHKLAINTKEIDLEISPAKAIETDVWCYINDNPNMLDCSTGTTSVSIDTDVNFSSILNNYAHECEGCLTTNETITGWTNNLIINGTFDVDLSNWELTPVNNSWVWSGGTATNNNETATISQNVIETGETYYITFDVLYDGGGVTPSMTVDVGNNIYNISSYISDGYNTITFTAQSLDSTIFSITANDNGFGLKYWLDNVQVLKLTSTTETYDCLTNCDVISKWGVDVELDCRKIYSNPIFYSGNSLTDVPSTLDYVNELNQIANTLGLGFTSGDTNVIFTSNVDCSGVTYINNNFKVNLNLDITTNCNG